ncbi:hypothetical protein [Bradyrhizobium guangdongense]|uniref:Uncharacterized protein n=1 Tax=Bradyrhizobium guangdongense TaxID=1325090 RepID=A0A410V0F0_9BRAD|nr:hypothetical protein [Bradyrhizobium guangdongense]QAU37142.1 hypothetical protein X265_05165 [Bradyrhizobium guangdongense]QOZ58196.1 hypothetical protein XH86_05160 [Bradyrhizobium guangdongense]GGI21035.1 hypothetical protein GCM10010987_12360 [Bradyrhizobium guangdongense]
MLEKATAILATIPPGFAILVELFNPISSKLVERNVEQDLKAYETASEDAHDLLIRRAAALTTGAVEVSGLAPTLVAAVTSGFGVLYEYSNPSLIICYVLVFMALALFLLRYLGGHTLYEIEDGPLPFRFAYWEINLPFRGSSVVSFLIYLANTLLITFVWIVYHLVGKP